jgi:hypothetical protein
VDKQRFNDAKLQVGIDVEKYFLKDPIYEFTGIIKLWQHLNIRKISLTDNK